MKVSLLNNFDNMLINVQYLSNVVDFHLLSFLEITRIVLNTDVTNTCNFLLCSYVHVSAN